MATADATSLRSRVSGALERVGLAPVHVVVLDITFVALLARLYDLGGRVVHWDEARVGYWTLRYMETGNVEYRPIIHGPFYHHVNGAVFDLVGASPFSMRLVVAVVGGLLPLTALCFRDRLSDLSVAALAGFLAFSPALVYYSRFMRGDPLVAAFCFAAFAFGVRAIDTRRRRYVLAAVGAFTLGLTVKENAVLYPVCWLGAALFSLDHHLLATRDWRELRAFDGEALSVARESLARGARLLWRNALVVAAAVVEFLAIMVFFYAPRTRSGSGPGLEDVADDPGLLPEVVWLSTGGAATKLWNGWIKGSHQDHSYIPFFGDFLQSLAYGALAVALLALLGFVVDRYRRDGPTTLVQFGFYWGFFSLLGYPLVTDIKAPWATVNAVVAFAVPAAFGFALLVRWARDAREDADDLAFAVACFAVLVVVGQVGLTTTQAVYVDDQSESNHLVQYAQPAGDIGPVMGVLGEAGSAPGGPDIVFYGDFFVDGGPPTVPRKPGCIRWFNALPLPWYLGTSGAEVACAENGTALDATLADAESPPAIVVARERAAPGIAGSLEDYEAHTYLLRLTDTPTTFFVDEDHADALAEPPDELPENATTPTERVTHRPRRVAGQPRRVDRDRHAYSPG
jgi:uncharacterized protein (TIGR03663 family)